MGEGRGQRSYPPDHGQTSHRLAINHFTDYCLACVCAVVKNPLSPVEHPGGEGVKNELFELGLDQFVRGLM